MDSAQSTISALSSPIFSVYAGPSKKLFLVHGAVLSTSPVLRSIVEGQWKESEERSIKLEEWDEQTVEHVLQWLYFRAYMRTSPCEAPLSERKNRIPITQPQDCKRDESAHNQSPELKESTNDPAIYRPLTPLLAIDCPGPPEGETVSVDLTAIATEPSNGKNLLSDARVYILAQYLQLEELKRRAFDRVKVVLSNWELGAFPPDWVRKTTILAGFVYDSTDSLVNSKEPMRRLVSTFVATGFIDFQGLEAQELLAKGGDFVLDVTRKVQREWHNENEQV
ncbi:MAG: hypothetical protein Q9210_006507 [Variospora velana]